MVHPTATRRSLLRLGTSAAAYAAGAALVAGGVALASEAKSEAVAPIAIDPLTPFAQAWLAQWTEKGGSVLTIGDGEFHFGWAEYYASPAFQSDEKHNAVRRENGWSADLLDRSANYDRGHYDGSMRALLEMLKAVPGGVATVKAIVANDRRAGWMPSMREAQA